MLPNKNGVLFLSSPFFSLGERIALKGTQTSFCALFKLAKNKILFLKVYLLNRMLSRCFKMKKIKNDLIFSNPYFL